MVRVTGLSVGGAVTPAGFVDGDDDAVKFDRDRNGCERARTWFAGCNDATADASVLLCRIEVGVVGEGAEKWSRH